MSNGEIAFLGLVILAFGSFAVGLAFVSIWSGRPSSKISAKPDVATQTHTAAPEFKRAA